MSDELQRMAYVVSHDLPEPLRMVDGFLGLIARRYEDALGEDGMELLDLARDGANRMNNMLAAILEYSRVETHGGERKETDVAASVVDWIQPESANGERPLQSQASGTVWADPNQFDQALHALLDNAVIHGQGTINVSSEVDDKGNLVIVVRDEGEGIPEQFRDQVFDLFRRLHPERPGVGAGLTIARRIAHVHGGACWVEGATAYLAWPMQEARP